MKQKAKFPIRKRSEHPTLTGTPPLGYLNSCYCPVCRMHLFSYYDADVLESRGDGYSFSISGDWNYCSKCGTLLELSRWKREHKKPPQPGVITGADETIEFSE